MRRTPGYKRSGVLSIRRGERYEEKVSSLRIGAWQAYLCCQILRLRRQWKEIMSAGGTQEKYRYIPDEPMEQYRGKWHYFDNVGYMVHDKWIGDYYQGSDGAMLISTVTPDGYRVDASGKWISGSPEETIFENFIQRRRVRDVYI